MALTTIPTPSTSKTYFKQAFTSTGSITLPSTTDGFVDICLVGGGGGGGGGNVAGGNRGGGGGGGGQVIIAYKVPVAASTSLTFTIGSGGNAGATSGDGGAGNATSVNITYFNGTSIIAAGGAAGRVQVDTAGGRNSANIYGFGNARYNSPATWGNFFGMGSNFYTWQIGSQGDYIGNSGSNGVSAGYPYNNFSYANQATNTSIALFSSDPTLIPSAQMHPAAGTTGTSGTGSGFTTGGTCTSTTGFAGGGGNGYGLSGTGQTGQVGGGAGGGGGFGPTTAGKGGNATVNSGGGGGGGGTTYPSAGSGTGGGTGGSGFAVIGYYA
jgi:hypothetical protein